MGSLTPAWLVGIGVYTYREVSKSHRMPVGGSLLAITAFFVALGLVAEVVPASAQVVQLGAWGLDIAGVVQLFRGGKLPGEVKQAQQAESSAAGSASP